MSSLSNIQHVIQQVCTPLAFSINTLLIQLILNKSPKRLGVYKYLMIYISLFEMLYSILDIVTAPDFYSYDSMFLVITNSDKILAPKWAQMGLTTVFCTMFGVSMAMFGINFVYRTSYATQRGLSLSNIKYIGPNFWVLDNNGNYEIATEVLIGIFFILIMVTISILTIIIFATLSYQRMGTLIEVTNNSQQYRNLQIQLLNSLVAQALIPAFLMQGPSCIVFTAPFFHKGTELLGGVLGITVSLYPVLDPLPTMFVIKHYRNALLKCCRASVRRTKTTKSTKLTGITIKI